MPDEFPTLEAVAALATLTALVRAAQVLAALGELKRLSAKLARALERGDREAARRVCAASEGAAFSSVASALLHTLGTGPVDRSALERSLEQATGRVAKRSRRASTSGGLISLLLVGLVFFAIVSRVSPTAEPPSASFDVIVIVGAVVLTAGIFLNQRLASETRKAARRMLEAAARGAKGPA